MKTVNKISRKPKKLVIGLMSGTSADGIDAAVVEIRGSGAKTNIRQVDFVTVAYPRRLKSLLLKNSHASSARLDEIARLNLLLGELFADAAKRVVKRAGLRMSDIDLIGSHGQTICHLPELKQMFRKEIRATMQIGDPSVIAKHTGVVTIGDFRAADVAVGGTGAPLVPYVDYILFRSAHKNRALLNIGGIANITVLPQNCKLSEVFAFDTGPGNMVIDGLMKHLFERRYDRAGETALRGKILPKLLRWMARHPYLRRQPPKSTGRELFGEPFVKEILRRTKYETKADIVATASEYTALAVYDAYLRFIRRRVRLDELLISGGGVHNCYLMDALRRYFSDICVEPLEEVGFSVDAKEAVCFAILANECIVGHPANVLGATGAKRSTVLGKICLP